MWTRGLVKSFCERVACLREDAPKEKKQEETGRARGDNSRRRHQPGKPNRRIAPPRSHNRRCTPRCHRGPPLWVSTKQWQAFRSFNQGRHPSDYWRDHATASSWQRWKPRVVNARFVLDIQYIHISIYIYTGLLWVTLASLQPTGPLGLQTRQGLRVRCSSVWISGD